MIVEVENTWDRIDNNDVPCEICRLIIVTIVKSRANISEKKCKIRRFLIEKSCR
jgi:hypothetical protein